MPDVNGVPQTSTPHTQSAEPTNITPGPRAIAFTTLYHSALQSTLKAISYDSFAACFPRISAQMPQALRVMWQGMRDGLETFARSEFEMILEERQVVSRLNALESIISDAIQRKDASLANGVASESMPPPPHTLPPEQLVKAHLTPLYQSQQSQLNARLQTLQSLNAGLMAEILDQREEITAIVALTEKLVGDVEGASEVLSDVEMLGREARQAEIILDSFESTHAVK